LEKKAAIRKIQVLQIIGLLEADFYMALNIFFFAKILLNVEAKHSLFEKQWEFRGGAHIY